MKRFYLWSLLVTVFLSTPAFSQKNALLFNFSGLNNLTLGSYNNGVGYKHSLSDANFLRGSLGYTSTTVNGVNSNSYAVTGGLFHNLVTSHDVTAYCGGQVNINHSTAPVNTFGAAAVVGLEYGFWQNFALGTEYAAEYMSDSENDISSFTLGGTSGTLIFSVYF